MITAMKRDDTIEELDVGLRSRIVVDTKLITQMNEPRHGLRPVDKNIDESMGV